MNLNEKHNNSTCNLKVILKALFMISPLVLIFKKIGFFSLCKSLELIDHPIGWKNYFLLPFRIAKGVLKIGMYYAIVISSVDSLGSFSFE